MTGAAVCACAPAARMLLDKAVLATSSPKINRDDNVTPVCVENKNTAPFHPRNGRRYPLEFLIP
ncbi:hypothetical protein HUK84_17910 [Nguyenibacter vanlangensis]|uniref:Uncharacterized protein n=1 Tax=Nguyenibacter vanlangensis TaxID=1216886 RepID=A0A7Y7IYZ5_9PROT|nr:hypothetical protein [Nguyenibacter vanlangensis]